MTRDHIKDRHKRLCSMLDYALTLGGEDWAWVSLSVVLLVRLSTKERRRLLAAALDAVALDDAVDVFNTYFDSQMAGPPLPVLDVIDDDARWWADLATQPELEAWLAACFVRLPVREQQKFLSSAMRRAA